MAPELIEEEAEDLNIPVPIFMLCILVLFEVLPVQVLRKIQLLNNNNYT